MKWPKEKSNQLVSVGAAFYCLFIKRQIFDNGPHESCGLIYELISGGKPMKTQNVSRAVFVIIASLILFLSPSLFA